MSLVIGLVLVLIIIVFFLHKQSTAVKTSSVIVIDDKVKTGIITFVDQIILDYYNEYQINYLSVRYNIKELESETSYVFKTKRIGTLANILDFNQVSFGEKFLKELIEEKYNVVVSIADQLSFITEISRIEGKIKAVESVKNILLEEDYKRLISEFEEDIIYYKNKFDTILKSV